MALIPDTGVTLMRLDYAESSQVLAIFTRGHGKVRAIAKGVKRSTKTRFAVGIDLLEIGDLVVSVRQPRQEALAILTEWKQSAALSGLRTSLDRLNAAQYACEITAALTEDWDPHPGLHDGLVGLLTALCDAGNTLGRVVGYQATLLHEIGLWPQWEACVSCQRPPAGGEVYFSSFEGGVVCRDCETAFTEKRLLDQAALRLLQTCGNSPGWPTSSEVGDAKRNALGAAIHGVFDVLNYHISHQMGRAPLLASKLLGGRRDSVSPTTQRKAE